MPKAPITLAPQAANLAKTPVKSPTHPITLLPQRANETSARDKSGENPGDKAGGV